MRNFLHQRKDDSPASLQGYQTFIAPTFAKDFSPINPLSPSPKPLKLGEWLFDQNWITSDQLSVALKEQSRKSRRLGELMVELGFITNAQLRKSLSTLSGLPSICLASQILDRSIVHQIPLEVAKRFQIILFQQDEAGYHVAMADPEDLMILDKIRILLDSKVPIYPYHSTLSDIFEALEAYYPQDGVDTNESEIISLVNNIILEAVRLKASDIHLSPTLYHIDIHYRQDGLLHQMHTLHKERWSGITSRLKILSGLDLAESRRPQNGRFSMTVGGRDVDFRLSCHPTIHGENLVLRILDKTHALRTLDQLGFDQSETEILKRLVNLPQGLILISGPTGSGKTTTLYALLRHINAHTRNIMTLEEPVEYYLANIHQTEIREGGPIRFAEGVRSLLRQDPDVILISEIRDAETAEMALRAAMTGHLVLGTIHANNSFAIPNRLKDLDVSLSLLKGILTAGVSQRLVRRLCETCRYPKILSNQDRKNYALPEAMSHSYQAGGCAKCQQTGYRGREAVTELALFDNDLLSSLQERSTTLWDRGIQKVIEGKTTLAEIDRVIGVMN